jgi:hypothetical protein
MFMAASKCKVKIFSSFILFITFSRRTFPLQSCHGNTYNPAAEKLLEGSVCSCLKKTTTQLYQYLFIGVHCQQDQFQCFSLKQKNNSMFFICFREFPLKLVQKQFADHVSKNNCSI